MIFSAQELNKIRKSIETIVRNVVEPMMRPCLRVYKAKVSTSPYLDANGKTVCSVQLIGEQTEITVETDFSDLTSGQIVYVATIYNSFSNAFILRKV